ncbi:MAG: glutamine-hydrolyzing GMP synthase [Actinomycetota bacterium]|nr:glutamine-hydrolyzing GMP synthase [Actinomycetota bacterium]
MKNVNSYLENIIVLDFGGQYSQLIARRVRELRVYSELVPFDADINMIKAKKPKGIILSGSPFSVLSNKKKFDIDPEIFNLGIPILGICYGMQLMAHVMGGKISTTNTKEYGKTKIKIESSSKLFENLQSVETGWMSHRDSVSNLPPSFKVIASTDNIPIAGIEETSRNIFGIQFHPEVRHTPSGVDILKNFLFKICKCSPTWTMVSIIEKEINEIRNKSKDGKIICALSGGVDSSVAAILVNKAVGDRLTCIFVDHGLLRMGEAEQVEKTFKENFKINLVHVKAKDRFLSKLSGVTDPETKRKIIGTEFIRIFEEEAKKIKDADYLVQGTLYSDVIESGTKNAARIKSHHNVGGLPDDMQLKLIEPLRMLFKDEVRILGIELGLPEEIVWRQPFPGPGLAIRIIGEVNERRLEILQKADYIVIEEIKRAGLYNKIWQSFAVLPAIRSVGVMGDERTYDYPIIIRAVNSEDAMTADWVRLPYDVLEKISSRIINEVKGVNRVVYDISSKPPSTIEWE